jgi:hypothetical protein
MKILKIKAEINFGNPSTRYHNFSIEVAENATEEEIERVINQEIAQYIEGIATINYSIETN